MNRVASAFPNGVGRPLDHLSKLVWQLGEAYKLELPTATQSQHAAATATARLPEIPAQGNCGCNEPFPKYRDTVLRGEYVDTDGTEGV